MAECNKEVKEVNVGDVVCIKYGHPDRTIVKREKEYLVVTNFFLDGEYLSVIVGVYRGAGVAVPFIIPTKHLEVYWPAIKKDEEEAVVEVNHKPTLWKNIRKVQDDIAVLKSQGRDIENIWRVLREIREIIEKNEEQIKDTKEHLNNSHIQRVADIQRVDREISSGKKRDHTIIKDHRQLQSEIESIVIQMAEIKEALDGWL